MENTNFDRNKISREVEIGWMEDITGEIENRGHSDFVGNIYVGDIDRLRTVLPNNNNWSPFKLNWARNLINWENEDTNNSRSNHR